MTELDDVRYERDVAKAAVVPLKRENERLRLLLKYAQEAIMAEYHLRRSMNKRHSNADQT